MYLMKLDGSKLERGEEKGEAQRGYNGSGPILEIKEEKRKKETKCARGKENGRERCERIDSNSINKCAFT